GCSDFDLVKVDFIPRMVSFNQLLSVSKHDGGAVPVLGQVRSTNNPAWLERDTPQMIRGGESIGIEKIVKCVSRTDILRYDVVWLSGHSKCAENSNCKKDRFHVRIGLRSKDLCS